MNETKVLIDNWPNNPWFKDWMPIIIALIALVTSIVSLYLTRQAYVKSSRPFVWASNYGVIDVEKKNIIPIPFRIGFRVKNTPAQIVCVKVEIKYRTEILFSNVIENIVRFPDEKSEWSYSIGKIDFEKIMNRPDSDKINLTRLIFIKYTALGGGKEYQYQLNQLFEPTENQWKDIYENAE